MNDDSCSINGSCKETINLPDGEIVPLIEGKSLSPAHEWEKKLELILDEMLYYIENNKDFGYFDSIIDVQTHALLIEKAMRKYVLEHNKRWCERNNADMDDHMVNMLISTIDEVKECFRGGYSTESQERILRVLTK